MNLTIKKIVGYLLVLLVLIFTIIGILGVWEVINLHDVIGKFLMSLLIIFIASAVALFIFSVVLKDDNKPFN
jgi:predicted RND superfamily exporter protein